MVARWYAEFIDFIDMLPVSVQDEGSETLPCPWTNKVYILKKDISDVRKLRSSDKAQRPKVRYGLHEGIRWSISSTRDQIISTTAIPPEQSRIAPASSVFQFLHSKQKTHHIQDAIQEHHCLYRGLLGRQRRCWPTAI